MALGLWHLGFVGFGVQGFGFRFWGPRVAWKACVEGGISGHGGGEPLGLRVLEVWTC